MKKNRMIFCGFRVMRRHKVRSFFMMIGIVAGVTILTLAMSIGRGTEKKVIGGLKKMFDDSNILISAGGARTKGAPMQLGQATTLTIADMETIQRDLPEVVLWDPVQMISGREVRYKGKSATTRIMGYSERSAGVWNRGAARGDYFDEEAVSGSARVALLGANLASELFGEDDPIGEQIQIGDIPFRVLGVLESWGTDPHGLDRDHEIIVPITTIMRRLMNVDYISSAKLVFRNPDQIEKTAVRIREILRDRHHLAPAEADDFQVMTPTQVRNIIAGMNRLFRIFLPLIALVSILVGGIIVANLMLISVQERTEEIGLRIAVGARPKDILWQFLLETTALTSAGGLVGVVVGISAARLASEMMKIPYAVSWTAVAAAAAISVAAGILAGVLPARRAAALDPVKTLR
jgi:putative ABC transport system permease protein